MTSDLNPLLVESCRGGNACKMPCGSNAYRHILMDYAEEAPGYTKSSNLFQQT